MHGLTGRIRELLREDLPSLQRAIDEAECVVRDLESGIEATPVDPERVMGPGGSTNRAPLSPLPSPVRRRFWDTRQLREVWDPVRDRLLDHTGRERQVIYPMALKILEERMDQRRALSTPIVQMIAEHDDIRRRLPGLRKVAVSFDPVSRQIQRVIRLHERHTRTEEIEIFPSLLQLADGNFDITATPLRARYQTGSEVTRSLRRARTSGSHRTPSLLERLKHMLKG